MQTWRLIVEWIALGIELLAVAVIVTAIITAVLPRGTLQSAAGGTRSDVFTAYKQRMGRGLLLSLELLLAADVVATVALRPTLESLAALGLLAVIRSFLSWSLDAELNGSWPWQVRTERRVTDSVQSARLAEAATRE